MGAGAQRIGVSRRQSEHAPRAPAAQPPLTGHTDVILLVEDDLVTCHIVTALLKRMGQPHAVVHTGAEAVERLDSEPVDLVIVDLLLPDTHGLDLVEQLLVKPYLQDVPVVVCTANADTQAVERAHAIGCVDVLAKPIVVERFADRIRRALERAPARWESWRDVAYRLRVDSRNFRPMLELAREQLADLLTALEHAQGDAAEANEDARTHLRSQVLRMRGAASNVGAIRTVHLVDFFSSQLEDAEGLAQLRSGLRIELSALNQALANRSSMFVVTESAMARRHAPQRRAWDPRSLAPWAQARRPQS
ncbi:hypothetical protein tb265_24740 [Gemmatimonadetes bacterium T265]|nr:hypothetical protein tb265_24740 [Gemmatimonadetes bacterium T265]